jgi:hypothetical protein
VSGRSAPARQATRSATFLDFVCYELSLADDVAFESGPTGRSRGRKPCRNAATSVDSLPCAAGTALTALHSTPERPPTPARAPANQRAGQHLPAGRPRNVAVRIAGVALSRSPCFRRRTGPSSWCRGHLLHGWARGLRRHPATAWRSNGPRTCFQSLRVLPGPHGTSRRQHQTDAGSGPLMSRPKGNRGSRQVERGSAIGEPTRFPAPNRCSRPYRRASRRELRPPVQRTGTRGALPVPRGRGLGWQTDAGRVPIRRRTGFKRPPDTTERSLHGSRARRSGSSVILTRASPT